MAARCLEHPRVAAHMERCFYIWPEKEPLQSDIAGDFRLLVVAQYCRELAELCKRHLRKEFVHVSDNLTGRVKGRILVEENIRQNLVRGRPDRTVCRYQVHSLDSPLNQILRSALEQCLKELRRYRGNSGGMDKIREWARQCQSTLAGVKLRRIHPAEFSSIHLGGLKKAYKKPLNLAKTVLSMLGSDPSGEIRTTTPPFALDMNELFERYCEVLLRKELNGKDNLWVGFHDNNLGYRDEILVRPDFIIENNSIIDAKYKYNWPDKPNNTTSEDTKRWDIFQMLVYSRHKAVESILKDSSSELKLTVMYPTLKETDRVTVLKKDLGEWAIDTYPVSLPIKEI